jgi:beta-D-xylosidase 4
MTQEWCAQLCFDKKLAMAGVEYANECFCGDVVQGAKPSDKCTMNCSANHEQKCGGSDAVGVFKVVCSGAPVPAPVNPLLPANCTTASFRSSAWCNTSLSSDDRVAALLKAATSAEKIGLLSSSNLGIPRLGVPRLRFSEALHGVKTSCGKAAANSTGCATSFPCALGTSASFNVSLFEAIGSAISTEARALDNQGIGGLSFWSPDINLFRDPRWGRY